LPKDVPQFTQWRAKFLGRGDKAMALHPAAAEERVTMRTPSARHVRAAAK